MTALAPSWLVQRLEPAGGSVPFATYMQWALHDPEHGAYGSGRLQVGPRGDFATSPSLGPDFAALLAPQLAEWLLQLRRNAPDQPLALVETGPGEGDLALQLAEALAAGWPELRQQLELVLVEPNPGMAQRQKQRLQQAPLPCRWESLASLAVAPLRGVVIAHEVLDALPVQRIVWDGDLWREQRVVLDQGALRLEAGEPLEPSARPQLEALGLWPPQPQRPPGWTSELHPGLAPWLQGAAAALSDGQLLVIDYAHEAWRYYAPQRANGTLMAYRQQRASDDPLQDPGHWDLTAHLCLESLVGAAAAAGWSLLGQRRQGEALLALGLAQRLHGLQHQADADLGELLRRREALLRWVDPSALGDFRWLAFRRGDDLEGSLATPLFLQDPPA